MHYLTYILTLTKDEGEAEANADGCLYDNTGDGHWFDYGNIDVERATAKLSDVRPKLIANIERCENELSNALKLFDKCRAGNDITSMGYHASVIAAICLKEFKDSMPFWNMETNDWHLPADDISIDELGKCWYAVPVDLHF